MRNFLAASTGGPIKRLGHGRNALRNTSGIRLGARDPLNALFQLVQRARPAAVSRRNIGQSTQVTVASNWQRASSRLDGHASTRPSEISRGHDLRSKT
ncbi:hypothetical protein GCM10017687_58550 [Streptomyces echinatus]